jgi:hypothetical protein
LTSLKANKQGYINFGDYCRAELGITCQYGYYLLEGLAGHPSLKEGIRLSGDIHNYHSLMICKQDAEIFRKRYEDWMLHPEKYPVEVE